MQCGKEKAQLSGTQWRKRATAKKKCKDFLTNTGEPEHAQLPGSEGREGSPEEADGSERGEVQESAGANALEPGRREGRAEVEAIRKLGATCRVEKEEAHFSGTQWGGRSTAKKKC